MHIRSSHFLKIKQTTYTQTHKKHKDSHTGLRALSSKLTWDDVEGVGEGATVGDSESCANTVTDEGESDVMAVSSAVADGDDDDTAVAAAAAAAAAELEADGDGDCASSRLLLAAATDDNEAAAFTVSSMFSCNASRDFPRGRTFDLDGLLCGEIADSTKACACSAFASSSCSTSTSLTLSFFFSGVVLLFCRLSSTSCCWEGAPEIDVSLKKGLNVKKLGKIRVQTRLNINNNTIIINNEWNAWSLTEICSLFSIALGGSNESGGEKKMLTTLQKEKKKTNKQKHGKHNTESYDLPERKCSICTWIWPIHSCFMSSIEVGELRAENRWLCVYVCVCKCSNCQFTIVGSEEKGGCHWCVVLGHTLFDLKFKAVVVECVDQGGL